MGERDDPFGIDSLVHGGISKEMRWDFSSTLQLLRSMRTAATSGEFDAQVVLNETQAIVDVMARRVVAQLLDRQNLEELNALNQQFQAQKGELTAKYGKIPQTVQVGTISGAIEKLVVIHGSSIQSPYTNLSSNRNAWERTFGFEDPPQPGQEYLVFSPLSSDYLEAYTLNHYYERAYAKRNEDAKKNSLPAVVIPQVKIVPVAFSKGFQVVAHPPITPHGGEIAMPYLDISEYGDTLRATQNVITQINPGMLPPRYRQFHKL